MAEAKNDRNREIYEAKEAGTPFTKLAEKYGMTVQCVKTIVSREERKERLRNYRWYQILEEVADREEMITRTVRVLEWNGYATDEAIMSVTRNQLLCCRNCGEAIIKIIFKIADILREEKK